MGVTWDDETDGVLGGDLTAALTYLTPAGGAVATSVAPVGLRDRDEGWAGFTTSMGFSKKLDRIARDPHVALAYHAREHGGSDSQRFVLVQGRAEVIADPDPELSALTIRQAKKFLGDLKRGPFWDRWLREYYAVRVPVKVHVDRVTAWPDLHCEGTPEITGATPPGEHPARRRRRRTGPGRGSTSARRPGPSAPSTTSSSPTGAPTASPSRSRSSWRRLARRDSGCGPSPG